jgi:serine/threonine protein kinase
MSSSPPLVVADRYRLVAPLGQGGMGRVWRATDVVLHREVAIKELVPPPGLTPAERQEMRERSLREARAIARLNNVNVVRVFDVLSTDADPWIVMEYVPSRSLQDALAADGPFNALRSAEIGLGVLNALRAAHRNGVVHRDVKPGNVLLGADGRVVLTDFGLATVPGDPNVTRTGLVLGSPAYIAPERARDGTAGPAADLWSLGATLYAAVEGQSPFARPSAIATLAALATENVPVARNAGPLKPVLNGLLRKDPAHRINAEEAERLLSRATGRRSKITFPMSPSMRRPGVGRERPSLPSGPGGPPVLPGSGWATATGSAPVVPNPRPPVVQPPAADGRPPHYASGKAQVGGQPPEMPRRGARPLDPTRLDTPPVRDDQKPLSGTGKAPTSGAAQSHRPGQAQVPPRPPASGATPHAGPGATPHAGAGATPHGGPGTTPHAGPGATPHAGPRATPHGGPGTTPFAGGGATPQAGSEANRPAGTAGTGAKPPTAGSSAAPTNALRTGFTAADVAANRRKQAAPEHEHSLAQATSGFPVVTPRNAPPAEPEASTESEASSDQVKQSGQVEQSQPEEPATPENPSDRENVSDPEGPATETESEPDDAAPATGVSEVTTADEPEAATGSEAETADEPEPEAVTDSAAEPEAADAQPAEDRTSVVAAPAQAEEKTSLLLPAARPQPAAEEKTSLLRPADAEEKTSLLKAADDDRTSVVSMPPRRRIITATEPATQVVGDIDPESGFARPSRPAWTPMQMRPVTRRSGGITILGTTLTRRQAAIGLGIVLTFLLLVGIIVVQAFGDGDSGKPNVKAADANPSAAVQGGGTKGPSQAQTSAPATPNSPPASSASATGGVPAGWRLHRGSGYSFPVPDKARSTGGGDVTLEWGKGRQIRVDIVPGKNDPVQYLKQDGTIGYNRVGPTPLEFHGQAADMQYYRDTGGNTQQRVVRRVISAKDTTYVLTWYTEADDWDAGQADLQKIYEGFSAK